jgi:hypothetical protein
MNHTIYIVVILVITFIIFIYYYSNEAEYKKEMEKIIYLENERMRRMKELEFIKSQTEPCHIQHLNDPRTCYVGSDYTCTWNDTINRCDKKIN